MAFIVRQCPWRIKYSWWTWNVETYHLFERKMKNFEKKKMIYMKRNDSNPIQSNRIESYQSHIESRIINLKSSDVLIVLIVFYAFNLKFPINHFSIKSNQSHSDTTHPMWNIIISMNIGTFFYYHWKNQKSWHVDCR